VVPALHSAPADGSAPRGIKAVNLVGVVNRERLVTLASGIEQGELKPPEIKRLTLQQAAEGLREVGAGHVRGKLVVIVT
jgi:hypothetical protein